CYSYSSHYYFFFLCSVRLLYLHSFPTRRSSDLASCSSSRHDFADRRAGIVARGAGQLDRIASAKAARDCRRRRDAGDSVPDAIPDRKSTRLNSSHRTISYAVFCLKKKKKQKTII